MDCPAHITHEFLAAQGKKTSPLNPGKMAVINDILISKLGTRRERAVKALRNMGPAVLNGGFSTFLSFVLLANSTSHVFETFFKVKDFCFVHQNGDTETEMGVVIFYLQIFFLVVAFALYNGLVVLPIILSHFGPTSSTTSRSAQDHFPNGRQLKEQTGHEKDLEMEMLPSKRD